MILKTVTIHQLGKLGEILPNNPSVEEIIDLNSLKSNFPVFDTALRINQQYYILSIKARKKYGKNGKLNSQYNILTGSTRRSTKFKKALDLLKNHGFDLPMLKFGFLVAPIEENKDCVYYMGLFEDVNPLFTVDSCLENTCGNIYVPVKEENLRSYKVFGSHSWDFIKKTLCED